MGQYEAGIGLESRQWFCAGYTYPSVGAFFRLFGFSEIGIGSVKAT